MLDGRYDRTQRLTMWEIVNRWPRKKLFEALAITGKRRLAGIIAKAIVQRRMKGAIDTPRELAKVIAEALGRERRGRVHVSTEWLMALRMAVNRELEEARAGIEAAARIIRPGGRLVVLSWDGTTHRTVRQTLRQLQRGCICPPQLPCTCGREPMLKILTPGGLAPGEAERKANPAARTCRLFAAEILALVAKKTGYPVDMLETDLDLEADLGLLAETLKQIHPDEVHINLPTRPPAEPWVQPPDEEGLLRATAVLGNIAKIVTPIQGEFDLSGYENITDAVVGIVTRHPMRENQLVANLARWCPDEINETLSKLEKDGRIQVVERYGVRFWSVTQAHYAESA